MLRRTKPAQIQEADHGATGAARGQPDGRPGPPRTGLAKPAEAQRGSDAAAPREPFTYVHRGTVVIGELVATGRVRVHGEIRGNVKVDGVLEVAESGSVEGTTVVAHEVKVLGRVTADVMASGKVEIWKGGMLSGNVSAPVLDIEEGATFNGFSRMVTDQSEVGRLAAVDAGGERHRTEPEASAAAPNVLAADVGGRSGRLAQPSEDGHGSAQVATEEA